MQGKTSQHCFATFSENFSASLDVLHLQIKHSSDLTRLRNYESDQARRKHLNAL